MTRHFWNALIKWRIWSDQRGQDMVEYALMASFVTIAVAATFPPVGNSISQIFSKMASVAESTP